MRLKTNKAKILTSRVVALLLLHIIYGCFYAIGIRLPIALLFGPFLLAFSLDHRIKTAILTLHFLPFVLFLFLRLHFERNGMFYGNFENIYYIVYDILSISSIAIYVYYVIKCLDKSNYSKSRVFFVKQLSFIFILYMLVYIAFLVKRITKPEEGIAEMIGWMLALLFVICIVSLVYLAASYKELKAFLPFRSKTATEEYRYGLTHKDLMQYAKKVERYFEESENYLDINFSLDTLASDLEIPKHHLSICFSDYFKMNFYTLLAKYRINEAIKLAVKTPSHTWEAIANDCGYGSRSTFNKHFKNITGCLPSEFSEEEMLEMLKL